MKLRGSLPAILARVALAVALVPASVVATGENLPTARQTVVVADDLLRVFQESKDAAEQVDPPEVSLGPAFEAQPDYR